MHMETNAAELLAGSQPAPVQDTACDVSGRPTTFEKKCEPLGAAEHCTIAVVDECIRNDRYLYLQ